MGNLCSETIKSKPISQTLDDERPRPDGPDQATFLHHLARYMFAVEQMYGNEAVLDAGCGVGYGTHLLSKKARLAVGMDYSPLAIAYAHEHYNGPNLSYAVMDAQRIALACDSFDLIVCFEVFEHFEKPDEFLDQCAEILQPGGRLILSTPNQETSDIHMHSIGMTNEFHISLFDLKRLRAITKRHFRNVRIYGQRRRGNRIYSLLRGLDVFNLRLRWLSNKRREQIQSKMGVVTSNHCVKVEDWLFARTQLRQANSLIAICDK